MTVLRDGRERAQDGNWAEVPATDAWRGSSLQATTRNNKQHTQLNTQNIPFHTLPLSSFRIKHNICQVNVSLNRGEVSNIIARVSFLVFLHYLANIVYRDIKAISPDFCDHNYLLWNTLCLCPLVAPDAHIYGRPCDLESRGNLLIILRLLIGYLVFIQRIHYKYSILPIPPRTIFQVFLEPFFSWNFPQLIFSGRKFCKLGYFISSLISSTCDVSKHHR